MSNQDKPVRINEIDTPNIKGIREQYKLSQGEFASRLGISVATLRNWEQGRRVPEGPARILLQVAAKHPEAVWDTVEPRSRQLKDKQQKQIINSLRKDLGPKND